LTAKFDWQLFPQAEVFLQAKVDAFLKGNHFAAELARRIEEQTSTRFFDWVDHLTLPVETMDMEELVKLGFTEAETSGDDQVFSPVGSTLFSVLPKKGKVPELAVGVEDLQAFGRLHAKDHAIQGHENAGYRQLLLNEENGFRFSAVERRGSARFAVEESRDIPEYLEALQVLAERRRRFSGDREGLKETEDTINDLGCARLSKERLADAFFRAERMYWQSRNSAAQVQKRRQDALGLGWGNTDHYTFRSSRQNFAALIRIFELLGLTPRERFHAGVQAGWGAQILEDAAGRVVVFADVDLAAEEKEADFAHQGLAARDTLGTVGFWVALHGESILQAGMHHLSARLNFDAAQVNLQALGVGVMKPFSNFPFLRQAFTEPEMWQVSTQRIYDLRIKNQVTIEHAAKFTQERAVGSHLENIQRGQGFRGFNQNSVSAIIKWADPRTQPEKHA
jgi:hypothetical protein